jgi:hypothetical protein
MQGNATEQFHKVNYDKISASMMRMKKSKQLNSFIGTFQVIPANNNNNKPNLVELLYIFTLSQFEVGVWLNDQKS